MGKKWSTGKIAAAVLGGVAAVILLWASLIVSIIHLSRFLSEDEYTASDKVNAAEKKEKDFRSDSDSDREDDERPSQKDEDDEKRSSSRHQKEQEEYYEFKNALQDDLLYDIVFEEYKKDDFGAEDFKGEAYVEFNYPVVSGDVTNLEGINTAIQEELDVVIDHVSSVVEYLDAYETYTFLGEAYVTYMSDEILSISYVEYGYLDDDFLESYVVSVNVDMETGIVLDNTQLLSFDDSFSVDFRERCERQNGKIASLDYMSDQEITSYLLDNDYLIALYTPLGMEIGFNYYDGWVTVTYKDYERYQKHF